MDCAICEGYGFLVSERDEGLMAIERCDTCERYKTDGEAADEVKASRTLPEFVSVERNYPFYLRVLVNGRYYRLSSRGGE